MSTVPADALGLAALVFLLGLRHGFDPDHLVAIDGLTRASRSRWSGLFFSLGHGLAVTLVGLVVVLVAADWQAPVWLEQLGALISTGVLLVLGLANLAMALRTPAGQRVPLAGMRSRWLAQRLARSSHPLLIASIGAAFALSFDTISHALLFSLTGASMAGAAFAIVLGLVFTLGMVLTDALSGWWVATLLSRADGRAARASRIMSLAIAFLCLAVAAGALAKYAIPTPALSVASFAVIAMAYLIARRLARVARSA